GVSDYVLKEKLDRLPFSLRRAMEEQVLRADRDRAERDLRESEQQYRSIIEGAPYGILREDQEGKILMANPAVVTMLGYQSEADLQQLNTGQDIYCDSDERRNVLLQFQVQTSGAHPEVTWRRFNGKQISVRLAGRRLSAQPNGKAVYEIFVENITEQRVLERQ